MPDTRPGSLAVLPLGADGAGGGGEEGGERRDEEGRA